jgi:hypothetical protein
VNERLPKQSQQATLRSLGDDALRGMVDRYVAAWERNDVDAVVAMLTEDARMTMPPLPSWYSGREAVDVHTGPHPGVYIQLARASRYSPRSAARLRSFQEYKRKPSPPHWRRHLPHAGVHPASHDL